jgi:hypothetical protein
MAARLGEWVTETAAGASWVRGTVADPGSAARSGGIGERDVSGGVGNLFAFSRFPPLCVRNFRIPRKAVEHPQKFRRQWAYGVLAVKPI